MHKLTAHNDELPTTVWIDDTGDIYRGPDTVLGHGANDTVDIGEYWLTGE
ncbi:hypothetical protein [Mycolicibacterium llatzerense]|nr:hypothetical protein [Mycolicibacterium llatzerense]